MLNLVIPTVKFIHCSLASTKGSA